MELYLIRHTTPAIAKSICYGQSDILLADSFLEEAQPILDQLSSLSIDQVYSSPLQRCALLAQQVSKPICYDDRLQELNFGSWELQPWNDIPQQELQPWMNDFVQVAVPYGESYIALQHRVLDFIDTLQRTATATATIVIITHAGPIRAILAHLRHIPLQDSFRDIQVDYGEVIPVVM